MPPSPADVWFLHPSQIPCLECLFFLVGGACSLAVPVVEVGNSTVVGRHEDKVDGLFLPYPQEPGSHLYS